MSLFKKIKLPIKYVISVPLYNIYSFIQRKLGTNVKVLDTKSTLKVILEKRMSVSRFGDGEFQWILMNRDSNQFEVNSRKLSDSLKNVLLNPKRNVAVCIPDIFGGLGRFTPRPKAFWAWVVLKNILSWEKFLNRDIVYFDSLFTRPYLDLKDKKDSIEVFQLTKKLWENRDVILIEGKSTRFGVGNDLLVNAHNVYRIIAPSENAFEKYEDIYERVILELEKNVFYDPIVLIALGPTATVLSNDLAGMCQTVDIGHLDIEYSWYLMHAVKKVNLKSKYVNEVKNGENVSEIENKSDLKIYENQIIAEIP